MSVITGTRNAGESTGARELHIILLDNGRSQIAQGPCREILKCVRCGACMNVCPVYRLVGGHAYASTYPGPMGIILTALLDGMHRAETLLDATTLCGACGEVCPVKVPLPSLLRRLREMRAEQGLTPAAERSGMMAFGIAVKSPTLYQMGQSLARTFWSVARGTVGGVMNRLPNPSERPFRKRM
jgi:L-lactate dehydrogenase complex protein LldF